MDSGADGSGSGRRVGIDASFMNQQARSWVPVARETGR